ncbi:unnamed protein product [Ceutorhynchus assimilis]|uniref:Uncharacterized protein n=1 Tax=Ceutorhynchus assimilis TaxID=467358 RepID=A0A9N9QRH6_9CUCU|nr:unnamed protein product [Ceutorhynchus assimilis]
MISKVLAFSALVAACQAGIVGVYPATSYHNDYENYQAPIYGHGYGEGHHGYEVDHHAHPNYKFSYGVNDPHTGDHKSQEEYRDGDVVKGHYTVADPDGTLRVVHYTADDVNGFNAVVEKHGHSVHPEPIHEAPVVVEKVVPVVEKVVYEKPAYYGHHDNNGYYGHHSNDGYYGHHGNGYYGHGY